MGKFKVGDKIRRVGNTASWAPYGFESTVVQSACGGLGYIDNNGHLTISTPKFKVGDRVRVIDDRGGGKVGDVGTITSLEENTIDQEVAGMFCNISGLSGDTIGLYEYRLEPAPLFAVGDKVLFNTKTPTHSPVYTDETLTIIGLFEDENGEPSADLSGYPNELTQITTLASLEHATTDEEAVPIYDPRKDGWATASGKFRVEAKATERSATAGIGLTIKAPKFKVGDFLTLESWPEHGYKITKIDHEGVHLSTKDGAFSWAYPVDREWIVVKPSTTGFTIPTDEEALPPKVNDEHTANGIFKIDVGGPYRTYPLIFSGGVLKLSNAQTYKPRPAIVALVTNGQPLPADKPKVHRDVTKATKEADRLAVLHPGQEFGVFELVSKRVATVDIREAA